MGSRGADGRIETGPGRVPDFVFSSDVLYALQSFTMVCAGGGWAHAPALILLHLRCASPLCVTLFCVRAETVACSVSPECLPGFPWLWWGLRHRRRRRGFWGRQINPRKASLQPTLEHLSLLPQQRITKLGSPANEVSPRSWPQRSRTSSRRENPKNRERRNMQTKSRQRSSRQHLIPGKFCIAWRLQRNLFRRLYSRNWHRVGG